MVNFDSMLAPVKLNGVSNANLDRKVFSIPCNDWTQHVVNEFQLYEISNSGKDVLWYKPSYLTFRKKGFGEMENLLKIEKMMLLNFSEDLVLFLNDRSFSQVLRRRVKEYANYMLESGVWDKLPEGEKLIFFLGSDKIELKNSPIPLKNNRRNRYFELNKLLNNEVV